jgi:multiple sugar transport system ATP-binding protein
VTAHTEGEEDVMASVSFDRVSKVFPDGTRAVSELTLEVADGEFVVLVGPSGCGKTTSLRMVAGLEDVTEGEIRIGERVVNELDPRERDIAMVFQNYALYPHMHAFDNMAFGLKVRRLAKHEINRRVDDISRLLGLHELLKRRPGQLSGGQRQRVAMGRAIVRDPSVFLMDEPLSNLDAKLRVQMRAHISRLQRELGATTIYVTHDQVEAMTMADRVAVMRRGLLQQVDVPQRIYDEPANLFVASFIGSPAMNLVEARLERRDGSLACLVGDQELGVPPGVLSHRPALGAYTGRTIALGIRPEHVRNGTAVGGDADRLRGRVLLTEALGSELLAHLEFQARPVVREEVLEGTIELDEAAVHDIKSEARERRMTFVGRFDAGTRMHLDENVEIGVDGTKLQFFDLDTGVAIRGETPDTASA